MRKIIMLPLVFAIVVLSSGCMDSGTMDKYEIYMQLYNSDVEEYNAVLDELIEKQDSYNVAYVEYTDAYDDYVEIISRGVRGGARVSPNQDKLDEALSQLVFAKNNYKFTANSIYSHLDEIEIFVVSNEKTLERNGIDTVQHKATIQDWKEEIRRNTIQYNL